MIDAGARGTGVVPRILLLSPAFPPARGGIERTAGQLATGLSHGGLEVVASLPPHGVAGEALPGVSVHWSRNEPAYGRRSTVDFQRLALRVGMRVLPDVVLVLHIRAAPAARAIAAMTGSRTVLVVHAKEMREQPALARAAVGWADQIVAVSRFARDLAREAGGDDRRISIVHPGVTIPDLAPPAADARPGPPTVVTVARMADRQKGLDTAISAFALLRSRIPDARWVMIGDGPLRAGLRDSARRLGLGDSIRFPGALPDADVERTLRSAHVFCMLSRVPGGHAAGEGFGMVYVEAGAQGLPVVATRVPGVVDAVLEGTTGLLVEPDAPQRAADALAEILENADLARRLALGGDKRARALRWPAVLRRYDSIIERALENPHPRPGPRPAIGWSIDLIRGPRGD